jgi:ABC-type antimicrobial peptide transport system permease subunit
MRFTVRTVGDPTGLVPSIRKIMLDLDPNVPIYAVSTQAEQIDQLLYRERLLTNQLLVFSLLALLQAALGIYGTLNYFVQRRSSEIGIRMAIGAQRREVMRLVLAESLAPVGIGVLLGLAGSIAAVQTFRVFLFGVSPADPLTISLATLCLVLIALLAAYLPVRRASRIDPMIALRHE